MKELEEIIKDKFTDFLTEYTLPVDLGYDEAKDIFKAGFLKAMEWNKLQVVKEGEYFYVYSPFIKKYFYFRYVARASADKAMENILEDWSKVELDWADCFIDKDKIHMTY